MSDQTFTSRHLPWAKIGHEIDGDVDSAEAAKLGGLDFDVELLPLSYRKNDEHVDIPSRLAVVRQDTDEWFSIVSTDYRVVQYRDAFNFLDEINPRYVAAGTMSDGRQGFMIVQLPGFESFDPTPAGVSDPHQLYAIVRTSHDLSKSIEVAVLTLREKCMNQLTLPSLTKNAPQHWTVRHVGDPIGKMHEAKRLLTGSVEYAEVVQRRIRQLASVEVDRDTVRPLLKRVLRSSLARRDEMVEEILNMADRETVGFKGTGWGWVNTVSEYFQWGRSNVRRTDQSIFTDSLDGDGATYTNKFATGLLSRA